MRLTWLMSFLLPLTINIASAQWWPIVRLTNTETASVPEGIAVAGAYVHVLYYDGYAPGHTGVLYTRSSDGGAHWSNSVLLDSTLLASTILTSGNSNVHVFIGTVSWGCYYRRSTNNGVTWLPEVLVADGYSTAPATNLASCLYVSFQRNDSIFVRTSTNNGGNWGSPQFVVWRDAMYSNQSLAADNDSRLHLCWADAMGGRTEGFYIRSTDNGASWQPKISLGFVTSSPWVTVDGQNNVYVFGSDPSSGGFTVRSTDGGATWGNRVSQWQWRPTCSANGWLHGAINMSSGGVTEVKYARSTDFGETWDVFGVSDSDDFNSEWSYLAVNDSIVHFVWKDFSPGNAEVYYRRGAYLNMVGVAEEQDPSRAIPLLLYPQPAASVLYVAVGQASVTNLCIYDVSGRRVLNAAWNCRAGVVSIELKALPTGVYSAVLGSSLGQTPFKFVVFK